MAAGKALKVAAAGEVLTGLALLVLPSLVARLLIGGDLSGEAVVVARVAGLGLIGLGLACWPGPPIFGMIAYSVSVAVLLALYGFVGVADGWLLWPAVVFHLVLAAALVAEWRRGVTSGPIKTPK